MFELVFKAANTDGQRIVNKRNGAAGWEVYLSGASPQALGFFGGNGSTVVTRTSTSILTQNNWYHAMFFVNRDDSADGSAWFINGVQASTTTSFTGIQTAWASGTAMNLGAYGDGTLVMNGGGIGYFGLWTHANWHRSGANGLGDMTILARNRFAQLNGTYPTVALGTATPTTSRSTTAYLDKLVSGNRTLYSVGANWSRLCQRVDSNSKTMNGYLGEVATTNECSSGTALNTNWNLYQVTCAATPATVTPNGGTSYCVTETTTSGYHTIQHGTGGSVDYFHNLAVGDTTNLFSIWMKAGSRRYVMPYFWDGVNGNGQWINCDLQAGTIISHGSFGGTDTYQSYNSSGVESWGNGWYRFWICCNISYAGSGNFYTSLYVCTDGAQTGPQQYSGNATTYANGFYIWGPQDERNVTIPSSYMEATSGPTARSADSLHYTLNNGNMVDGSGQTISCKILAPNYTAPAAGLTPMDTGGLRFDVYDATTVFDNASDLSSTYTGDVTDGAVHKILGLSNTNRGQVFVDTKPGVLDSSVTPVTGNTTLYVGNNASSANYANALISNLKIYRRPTHK